MIALQLQRLAKGTAVYGIGHVLNRFLGFLLLPVFTAYLSPEEYGINAILLMISGILTCVFSLGVGVSTGIYYYVSDELEHRFKTIWMATSILVFSVLLLFMIALPASGLISSAAFGSTKYRYLVSLTLIRTGLAIMVQPSMLYLQFEQRAALFVVLSVTSTVVSLGSSIWLVVFFKRGIEGLVEAALISQLISFLAYFSLMVRSLRPSYDISLAKDLLKIGLPYILGSVCFFLIQYVDRYMLEFYCGLKIVGIYSVGYNIGMLVMLFVGAFATAWTPYFNSFVNKQEEASSLFGHVLTYYIMGMGFLCLCMFLFAKPVVILMTTSSFHDAYTVVGIIALSQIMYGCYLIFLPGLYYAKKTGLVNFILLSASLLNIFLNAVLIPWFNMLGAGIATVASFLAMTVMTHFAAKKWLVVHYDWMKIFRYVGLWTVAAMISYVGQELSLVAYLFAAIFIVSSFLYVNYVYLNEKERIYIKKMYHTFSI